MNQTPIALLLWHYATQLPNNFAPPRADPPMLKKPDPALNDTCYIVTWCIKTALTPCLDALAGIAPPYVHRKTIRQPERAKQEMDLCHPLHNYKILWKQLKSRFNFLSIAKQKPTEGTGGALAGSVES